VNKIDQAYQAVEDGEIQEEKYLYRDITEAAHEKLRVTEAGTLKGKRNRCEKPENGAPPKN